MFLRGPIVERVSRYRSKGTRNARNSSAVMDSLDLRCTTLPGPNGVTWSLDAGVPNTAVTSSAVDWLFVSTRSACLIEYRMAWPTCLP